MPTLTGDERLRSDLLGDCYPYWWMEDDALRWESFADEALAVYPAERRTIDPVTVLSVLSMNFVCLDRTIAQGVSRLPWLSELTSDGTAYFIPAPPHGTRRVPYPELALEFIELLEEEIIRLVGDASQILLLLTGGMDSRVLSGTLKRLQERGAVEADIVAVTWGRGGTRDPVYGERLATYFGWEWLWIDLDSESYWDNFEFGAVALGGEVDPKHLHRMDWFERAPADSVVLAASYGDSVGRAEFSSRHLVDLPGLEPSDPNRLLRPEIRRWAWPRLVDDIRAIRGRHGIRPEHGWREIEQQVHYMRRMLQHTMCVINRWSRIEQVFVSPDIFGLMWDIHPEQRGDELYVHVLQALDPKLLEFAWARTGARYDTGEGSDDTPGSYQRYDVWLRRDHADDLGAALFDDDTLAELGIFDMSQVRWMYGEWRRERLEDATLLSTQLSYLGALAICARTFELGPPRLDDPPEFGPVDWLKSQRFRTGARAKQYLRRVSRPARLKFRSLLR